jgi:hypothetical protein
MSETKSSHDWFARSIALLAVTLTIVSLYFTHRTYTWQIKTYQESLEEKILLRAGFKYTAEKHSGSVSIDVVNIGLHPIYVESVQIEVPCDSVDFPAPKLPVACDECFKVEQICSLMLYRRDPIHSNKPMAPVEPGSELTYTMASWDFAKYPLQEWVKTKKLEDELWLEVNTTKKKFRQHPFSSWYQVNDAKGVRLYLPNAAQ